MSQAHLWVYNYGVSRGLFATFAHLALQTDEDFKNQTEFP